MNDIYLTIFPAPTFGENQRRAPNDLRYSYGPGFLHGEICVTELFGWDSAAVEHDQDI